MPSTTIKTSLLTNSGWENVMDITQDRRIKPRVSCEYPAIVEGYDRQGNKYGDSAKLANLSATGLYMRANRYIESGSKLSVTILLTSAEINTDTPKIATNGTVVRSEPQGDGSFGIAVKFSSYRFQ